MKRWIIYCHIHIESGRRYIGLTCKTIMARWNGHVNLAKRSNGRRSHFAAAIKKYGKDAFSHEVLEICHSLEEANAAEERLIEKYDTRNPEKGFNLMKGGLHIPHPIRRNPWDDPEYRKKCVAAAKVTFNRPDVRAAGRAVLDTPEYKEKSRTSINERKPWLAEGAGFAGRSHTLESKEKMSTNAHRRVGVPVSEQSKDKIREALVATRRRKHDEYASSPSPTHHECEKHGLMPIDSFYVRMRDWGFGPYRTYSCKACVRDYRAAHKADKPPIP